MRPRPRDSHRITPSQRQLLAVVRSFRPEKPTRRQIEMRYERWSHGGRIPSPGRRLERRRLSLSETEQP